MEKKKKSGIKGIVWEMYRVYGYEEDEIESRGIDDFSKKFSKYLKMAYEFDCGESFDVKSMRRSSYDKLLKEMTAMTESHTIANIEKWCGANEPYKLYCIKDREQIDFFRRTRECLIEIYHHERGSMDEKVLKKKTRMEETYRLLQMELQFEFRDPEQDGEHDFEKLSTKRLRGKLAELQDHLKKPQTESEDYTERKLLQKIVSIYKELWHREPSPDRKRELSKESKPYEAKLRKLQASVLGSQKEKEIDYLKLSIQEQKPMFPFDIEAPENVKEKMVYERCMAAYKPLDAVIKEARESVEKEYFDIVNAD